MVCTSSRQLMTDAADVSKSYEKVRNDGFLYEVLDDDRRNGAIYCCMQDNVDTLIWEHST